MEIGWLVKNQTVSITKNISREPAIDTQTTGTEDWCETTLNQCLTSLEIFTTNRKFGLFC